MSAVAMPAILGTTALPRRFFRFLFPCCGWPPPTSALPSEVFSGTAVFLRPRSRIRFSSRFRKCRRRERRSYVSLLASESAQADDVVSLTWVGVDADVYPEELSSSSLLPSSETPGSLDAPSSASASPPRCRPLRPRRRPRRRRRRPSRSSYSWRLCSIAMASSSAWSSGRASTGIDSLCLRPLTGQNGDELLSRRQSGHWCPSGS
mmetsp:Transcript_14867/g.46103  ORF Transcript_14867/g.46103 Transcript_14867/m.46103 type:complete len:206 (-) Transcript_14867:358-975(-)